MIQNAFLIAFIVHFLYACTWEGMIFSPIVERLWTLPDWVKKPLYGCPICMTPWWGGLILVVLAAISGYTFDMSDVLEGVVILFAAAGINAVFVQLFPQHEAK